MTDYSVSTHVLKAARALEKIADELKRLNDRNDRLDAEARDNA